MALFGGITLPGHPDLDNIRKLDLLAIPMSRRMMRAGIAIDVPYLKDLSSQLDHEMTDLRADIASVIPITTLDDFIEQSTTDDDDPNNWSPINVESTRQLSKLLFSVLGIGKGKELKTTDSGSQYSTGKKQLELLKQDHPVIQKVLDYRERSKLKGTYTDKLPRIARLHPRSSCCPVCELSHISASWRIHCQILLTRTDTGRVATKKPNLQNIPARTKLGRLVRAAFIPSAGCQLISWDFSQIELRLLAHAAIEQHLIDVFLQGLDPHTDTAMRAFGLSEEAVSTGNGKLLYRAPCKNVNFGIVYGLTKDGLYDHMALTYATAGLSLPDHITITWCDNFINQWFKLYPKVHQYMDLQQYRARRYGYVWDMFGRVRLVPECQSSLPWIRSAGLRQAGNMPIQADAAELMKLTMGKVEHELSQLDPAIYIWPLMTIHDELLFEADERYAEGVGDILRDCMNNILIDDTGCNLCRVPITSDGHIMSRWEKQ